MIRLDLNYDLFDCKSQNKCNTDLTCSLTEQSYNTEAHKEMMEFMETHSLNDGDKFCAALMRESSRHKSLGSP